MELQEKIETTALNDLLQSLIQLQLNVQYNIISASQKINILLLYPMVCAYFHSSHHMVKQ